MDKEQVAAILDEIGTLLELQGENPFRANAYHNAARAIEQLEANLADVVAAGKLGEVPGIGDTLREKITTLVTTGQLPFYDDLRAKIPPGLLQMLRVPGLGPKKVKALYDQLGIDDLDKLKAACEAGQVAKLKGFGAKTQDEDPRRHRVPRQIGDRVRIDQALPLADATPGQELQTAAGRHPHGGVRQPPPAARDDQGHRHPRQQRRRRSRSWTRSSSCRRSCR